MPTIRRAGRIIGHRLRFHDVDRDAAAFIVALRTDERRARHIGETSADVAAQIAYIDRYRNAGDSAYFLICDDDERRLGTVRLYDARGDSFSWGSWVLVPQAPKSAAIESALMVYGYAVDILGFSRAHFAVDIANERVWRFHERFGAVRTDRNAREFLYSIDAQAIRRSVDRYRRYLPDGIVVED